VVKVKFPHRTILDFSGIQRNFEFLETVDLGSSLRRGAATLVAGTSGSIADTRITTSSLIRLTNVAASGTLGVLSVALAAGVGFTINSSNPADTSKVFWEVVSY
jgi:hypothetical protein